MTLDQLKKYLMSIRTGGGQAVPQINDIVDTAIEAGFSTVWGAYQWKVKRAESSTLTCTSSQAYTILPDDVESVDSIVLINGTESLWIDLRSEGNFEIDTPYPSAYTSGQPYAGKVVFNSSQQGNRWRVYWDKIPDSGYSLRVIYQRQGSVGLIPQLPSYMLAAVVAACKEHVLPSGQEALAQHQIAEVLLSKAIQSDEIVSGPPQFISPNPGWNDDAFVGGSADGDAYLEGNPWLRN